MSEAFRNFDSLMPEHEAARTGRSKQMNGMTVRIFRSENRPPLVRVERFGDSQNSGRLHVQGCPEAFFAELEHRTSGNADCCKGSGTNGDCPAAPKETSSGRDESNEQNPGAGAANYPQAIVEPKIDILRMPGQMAIEVALPGVSSMDDVAVIEFDESVEIRAKAQDKKYLKIIQVPPEVRITGKIFSGGMLRIELGK